MKKYLLLTVLILSVIATQVVGAIVIFCHFGFPEKSGEFGDTFGAINTLFSGLAFCGVIFTVFLQSQELGLQREELSKSTTAQQKQAELALLSAKINAAISKQEIFASFIASEKQFPGYENYNFGQLRGELQKRMNELDRLLEKHV